MSASRTLAWLGEWQAEFSRVLRSPLDSSSGSFLCDTPKYAAAICEQVLPTALLSSAERLAVYNRQYWVRLFTLLQGEFPLTTKLLGAWYFNHLAQRFLREHLPGHWDLGRAADGFPEFLGNLFAGESGPAREMPAELPRTALLQAAHLDAIWRSVWLAPEQAHFHPTSLDTARLFELRLRPSAAFAVLAQDWPLLQLRQELCEDATEDPVRLPPGLPEREHWAIFRTEHGVSQLSLQPLQARLTELLIAHPLGEALARLERENSEHTLEYLAALTQGWLTRSVELGFWAGVD